MIVEGQDNGTVKPPRSRIGLFDSGAGGLSVLRRLIQSDADTSYVYLADTARCPYGNRQPAEIAGFAEQTARWLQSSAVDRIVMACNTSASIAGNVLRSRLSLPIHDLIRPVSSFCSSRFGTVAVFATSATCRSGAFSRMVATLNPSVRVLEIPCPELVPLVEAGHLHGPLADAGVQACLDRLGDCRVDAVVLGCTHFPFLSSVFRQLLPPDVVLIDPAEYLQSELFTGSGPRTGETLAGRYTKCAFFTTGDPDTFALTAERCLGLETGALSNSVCSISVGDFAAVQALPSLQMADLPGLGSTPTPLVRPNPGAEVSL